MTDPRQSSNIDEAYVAASEALSDPSAAARRRAAVLAAVQRVSPDSRPAVHAVGRSRATARTRGHWWSALAAACVIGLSSLLVLRMDDVSRPGAVQQAPEPVESTSQGAKKLSAAGPAAADNALGPPLPENRERSVSAAETSGKRIQPAARSEAVPRSGRLANDSVTAAAEMAPNRARGDVAAAPPGAAATALLGSVAKSAPPGIRPQGLIAAVQAGDLAGIERLLADGAAVDEIGTDGRSALAHAVLQSNLGAVKLLLAAGADRSRLDREGLSPLDHAIAIGNRDVLAALKPR